MPRHQKDTYYLRETELTLVEKQFFEHSSQEQNTAMKVTQDLNPAMTGPDTAEKKGHFDWQDI